MLSGWWLCDVWEHDIEGAEDEYKADNLMDNCAGGSVDDRNDALMPGEGTSKQFCVVRRTVQPADAASRSRTNTIV